MVRTSSLLTFKMHKNLCNALRESKKKKKVKKYKSSPLRKLCFTLLWSASVQYFPNTWRMPRKFTLAVQLGRACILLLALMFDCQSRGENRREDMFASAAYNDDTEISFQVNKWRKMGWQRSWWGQHLSCLMRSFSGYAKESEPSWWRPLHSFLPVIIVRNKMWWFVEHTWDSQDASKWMNEWMNACMLREGLCWIQSVGSSDAL